MKGPARGQGRLVAVEGIDGAGKSTFVRALGTALRRRGWSVAVRREPSDPALGALAQRASVTDPWTGGVYFTVDRHLARKGLANDLATHDIVLSDRSFYSTLAYQGSALPPRDRGRLERLQRNATIVPDRAILLDLDPRRALDRLGARALRRGPLERLAILRRVSVSYRGLSRRRGWILVDALLPTAQAVRAVLPPLERILSTPGTGSKSPSSRRRR
jgi:dTMP kinase